MVDSDCSSEEETCEEMNRLTLDEVTEPWVYYEDNFFSGDKESYDVENFKGNGFGMIKSHPVCGIIQISGQLHIEHLPCDDHHDEYDQEDDSNINKYDSKDENSKHEQAVLHEDNDEDPDTRHNDADQTDHFKGPRQRGFGRGGRA